MNDRFKVRIWDKSFRKMLYNNLILCYKNKITAYDYLDNTHKAYLPQDHIVIEQCTGKKDKNGTLIYEGDIVKSFVTDYLGKDYCLIGYIVWDIDRWQIKDVTGPVFFDLYDAVCDKDTGHDKNTIEVIGNIHENKELLKGEQECN